MKIEAPGSSLNGSTKIFVFKYLKISDVHVNCPGGGGGGGGGTLIFSYIGRLGSFFFGGGGGSKF